VPNLKSLNIKRIKKGRLQKRPEFLAVSATGHKWVSDTVIVQYKPDNNLNEFRYGITATKRVGNAVIRNRCKRRLRSVMELIKKDDNLNNADIVLIARHSTPSCDWDKLIGDLRWCLTRLGLFSENDA
jgi:ribonuclease P protein component